jgi:hypothetical protein
MAGTNDFKAIATGGGANVITQSEFAALTSFLANGFSSGVVESDQFNKVIRQASFVASGIGKIISDVNLNALDDGNLATFASNLLSAIATSISSSKSHAASGYQVFPGGLVVQWGTVTVAASGVNTDVTLPLTFPNNGFQSVVSPANVNTATYPPGSEIISTTTIRFNCNHTTTVLCRWIAIGN